MYPKVENVSRIIEQMGSLSPNEKTHLMAVFDSLASRQEAFFSKLKEEVKAEMMPDIGDKPEIYVALVGSGMRNTMQEYSFFEICPDIHAVAGGRIEVKDKDIPCGSEYTCGIVYWDTNYDLIDEAVLKKYSGSMRVKDTEYEVEYSLKRTDVFVRKEKEIEKISVQYGIETPLVYNPMARRALELTVKFPCGLNKSDIAVIDFLFDVNKLRNRVILDSYLMWNISEMQFEELLPAKTGDFNVPLWDKTFIIYCFPVKNENVKEYILVNHDLRAIKRVGDNIYWQLKEECPEMTYKKYSLHLPNDVVQRKIEAQSKYVFHNGYEIPFTGEIQRIRTKGDAVRCVSCFKGLGIACLDILQAKELEGKNIIYTYPKRLDYYQLGDGRLKTNHCCAVCFEDNQEDLFFVDKISYIVGYMNHRYPEYQWIGVR